MLIIKSIFSKRQISRTPLLVWKSLPDLGIKTSYCAYECTWSVELNVTQKRSQVMWNVTYPTYQRILSAPPCLQSSRIIPCDMWSSRATETEAKEPVKKKRTNPFAWGWASLGSPVARINGRHEKTLTLTLIRWRGRLRGRHLRKGL